MRRAGLVVVAAVAAALGLMPAPGSAASGSAPAAPAPGRPSGDAVGARLHDSAKEFGEGLLGGVKFVGRTVINAVSGSTRDVGRDADAVGQRLHRGAKHFGEGLLDGARYAGRTVGDFFSERSGRDRR
jgi:hypothetical protein